MAIDQLQMALIGAGGAVVAGIFAFNKWQERKHRKAEAPVADEPPTLQEPVFGSSAEPVPARVEPIMDEPMPEPTMAPRTTEEASARRTSPQLLPEVDERADWVLRIESIEALMAGQFIQQAEPQLAGVDKPLRWYGFSESANRWEAVDRNAGLSCHWLCVVVQLVDRRGPISPGMLSQLNNGIQAVSDGFMAIPNLPASGEALARAQALDEFCAGVDIQIAVNVLAQEHQPFSGTKLRGLAEAAGMELLGDGRFHAKDETGATLYMLSNLENELFAPEEMRRLVTRGVTLTLDVPRVGNGVFVFERMMAFARQMAQAMQGAVVDDNRQPFGEKAIALIRAQIGQFQGQMVEKGIPPGSPLARRLFS